MAVTTTSSPKSRRWWLIAIALLAVSLAGFGRLMNFSLRGQSSDSAADRPERRFVVCYGYVGLEQEVSRLHPTVPGRVATVLVQEGDYVPKDAVLLRLVDDVPLAQVAQAKAELDDATAQLNDARAKAPERHRLVVQQQNAKISVAKHQLSVAEGAYKHAKEMFDKKAGGSQTTVDAAKDQFEAAQTAVEMEETALKQLHLQDPQAEIRRLEALVAK